MNARIVKRRWVQEFFDACQCNHMPGLQRAGDDALVAVWSGGAMQFNGDPEGRDGSIWMSRLAPAAEAWSVPEAIGTDMRYCCHNGHLVQNRHGELLLLFCKWLDTVINCMTWCNGRDEVWVKKSVDNGLSWLPARKLDLALGTGIPSNDGLLLPDGDLLLAVTSADVPERYYGAIRILRSTDDGATWTREALLVDAGGTKIREPALALRPNGDVVMYTRACPEDLHWGTGQQRTIYAYTARSADGGRTWTDPVPGTITNNESKLDILTWRDGTLLMAYDRTTTLDWRERSPLWLARSADEGRTWEQLLELEPGPGIKCQPALCTGADGLLHVVYMHRHTAVEHIAVALED